MDFFCIHHDGYQCLQQGRTKFSPASRKLSDAHLLGNARDRQESRSMPYLSCADFQEPPRVDSRMLSFALPRLYQTSTTVWLQLLLIQSARPKESSTSFNVKVFSSPFLTRSNTLAAK